MKDTARFSFVGLRKHIAYEGNFSGSSFLRFRLLLAVTMALIIILLNSQTEAISKIRRYMDTAIMPLHFLINSPRQIADRLSQVLSTRKQMEIENQALRKKLLINGSEQQLLMQYKKENARLRELLRSPVRKNEEKMVAEVISTSTNPYNDQVVIDKGTKHGVYVGQPVISDKGIVGQVVSTNNLTSRVLLMCDASHALPVQILRNDIRAIISGNGCIKDLQLENVPINSDIRIGDALVTSGLGGRFPEGYPVAVVSEVKIDTRHACTIIHARPTAHLQYLRYLLLLWNTDPRNKLLLKPNEVNKIAGERLLQVTQ